MASTPCSGKAVILLSGGLDSATALAIAKAEGYELFAITFDYHQRHMRELQSARKVAAALKATKHLIVDFNMRDIGGSALTSGIEVPKTIPRQRSSAGSDAPSIPVTYVPARNTIFLSFGLAWAEVLGAEAIFIGANAIDYSGYPDCRPEYLAAFETMANLATKASVEGHMQFQIKAPLLAMTKADIIRRGVGLGLDYSLTWSCYDPQPEKDAGSNEQEVIPCGQCDSCRLRQKGFIEAGMKDPLV